MGSVSVYVTTTSLIVNETKTVALNRVNTYNGTSILVPSPCITRGRRFRGTVALGGINTTRVVRRGSLSNRGVVRAIGGLLDGPRGVTTVRGTTGRGTVVSTGREVCGILVRLCRGS